MLGAPPKIRLRRFCGCTQRFFEGFIARPPTLNDCKRYQQACPDSKRRFFFCSNDTVAVAMRFAMKNGQMCASHVQKFLAIPSAIQKIATLRTFEAICCLKNYLYFLRLFLKTLRKYALKQA